MKLLLVVNASASSVTARARVVIHKALVADHEVEVAETTRRGDACSLARNAAESGADAVVVLGGDGTLNEAANGLAGTPTALGIVPGGSTNVFARTIGMVNDPIEATGQLLSSLASGAMRTIGLGKVNDRYFLFHVGFGFDAAVVSRVERRASLKRYAGPALFVGAALSTWVSGYRYRDRVFEMTSFTEGETKVRSSGQFAICLNTNPYTYLGNRALDVVPEAGLDGSLSMLTIRRLRLHSLLPVLASALRGGTGVAHHKDVVVTNSVLRSTITSEWSIPYQVDGDHLGSDTDFEMTWEPEALRIIMPV